MDSQLIILVVAGTVGLMLMAFSLVFFVSLYKRRVLQNKLTVQEMETKHQQEMLNATLESQESERNRVGTELHDGVGAMLSTIKMNLQVSERNKSLETLPEVIEHLTETIGQVRSISHEMMPVVLKKYGLKKAVTDLFEKINQSNITASIGEWVDFKLDENNELMLYRMIQELLNNSLKHSNGSEIQLQCMSTDHGVKIVFRDNGDGFPKEVLEKSEGMGLLNVLTRAQTIGADLGFSNLDTGGAKIEISLNLNST